MARGRTLYSVETLEKDMKRIVGKRAWDKAVQKAEEDGYWACERSCGDIQYDGMPEDMKRKIVNYMTSHRRSRLYRSWTGCSGSLRFMVYGYF